MMLVSVHRTTKFLCLSASLLLVGCSVLPVQKRHSPAEIANYQPQDFAADITTTDGERAARAESLARIHEALALPPGDDPARLIPGALWNIGFLNAEKEAGLRLVLESLPSLSDKDAAYQRGVLSGAYTLYARESVTLVKSLLGSLRAPREFAIAAYTILKAEDTPTNREHIRNTMRSVHNDWQTEPRLVRLTQVLNADMTSVIRARPPLVDLLAHPIRAGKPVIFSFQRHNRQRFGMAVVRGANGKFVRDVNGRFFHVSHLANAITNLPGTITNGNTPQGLFTIIGAGTATNKWIGPTPYLESRVPVEATRAEFEHIEENKIENSWTDADYEEFLPETWRQYWPFKESYWAGHAGRNEMLIHGTTINSEYYRGQPFYPGTPSAGCMVALERWSKDDGRLLVSDQLTLIKMFTRDGFDRGYLVVVEVDDLDIPVQLADVERDIEAAEKKLAAVLAPAAASTTTTSTPTTQR